MTGTGGLSRQGRNGKILLSYSLRGQKKFHVKNDRRPWKFFRVQECLISSHGNFEPLRGKLLFCFYQVVYCQGEFIELVPLSQLKLFNILALGKISNNAFELVNGACHTVRDKDT